MSALPVVYMARHGGTAWTVSHRHTGLTDLPLTPEGELEAIRLGELLEGLAFAGIITSPLQRAVRTCELAGFGSAAEVEPDSWNGTTGATRVARPPRFAASGLIGSCSAMAAQEVSRRTRSESGPTGWCGGCERSTVTCCCFPVSTFCACSLHAGSGSPQAPAGTSCWPQRASASWATNTTG